MISTTARVWLTNLSRVVDYIKSMIPPADSSCSKMNYKNVYDEQKRFGYLNDVQLLRVSSSGSIPIVQLVQ